MLETQETERERERERGGAVRKPRNVQDRLSLVRARHDARSKSGVKNIPFHLLISSIDAICYIAISFLSCVLASLLGTQIGKTSHRLRIY